jgi:hypothetical protein
MTTAAHGAESDREAKWITPDGHILAIDVEKARDLMQSSAYVAALHGGRFSESRALDRDAPVLVSIPTLDGLPAACWERAIDLASARTAGTGDGAIDILFYWDALIYLDVDPDRAIGRPLKAYLESLSRKYLSSKTPEERQTVVDATVEFLVVLCALLASIDEAEAHPFVRHLPAPHCIADRNGLYRLVEDGRALPPPSVAWPALARAVERLEERMASKRVPPMAGLVQGAILAMVTSGFTRADSKGSRPVSLVDAFMALPLPDLVSSALRSFVAPGEEGPQVSVVNRDVDAFQRRLIERYPVFGPLVVSGDGGGSFPAALVMAGGAVAACVDARFGGLDTRGSAERAESGVPASDIDMWLYGDGNLQERVDAVAWLGGRVFGRYAGRVDATVRGAVVTFRTRDGCGLPRESMQIIVSDAPYPESLAMSFDMAHVSGYYDGENVLLSWPMLWAIATRCSGGLSPTKCICTNSKRVGKAHRKGFWVACPCASLAGAKGTPDGDDMVSRATDGLPSGTFTRDVREWRMRLGFDGTMDAPIPGGAAPPRADRPDGGKNDDDDDDDLLDECPKASCLVGLLALISFDPIGAETALPYEGTRPILPFGISSRLCAAGCCRLPADRAAFLHEDGAEDWYPPIDRGPARLNLEPCVARARIDASTGPVLVLWHAPDTRAVVALVDDDTGTLVHFSHPGDKSDFVRAIGFRSRPSA